MLLSLLSPEAQVLLLTAAGPDSDPALARLLSGPLDWGKLLWLAESEKAAPVLWRRLVALPRGEIPDDAAANLRRLAMVAEFRMSYLEQRLDETLVALADAGIAPLLLKGAALVHTVYDSFLERPMGDIDLLVESDRAAEAQAVALGAGWTRVPAAMSDADVERSYERHHHLRPLEDAKGTGIRLELHTALFPPGHPFQFGTQAVWSRARPITVRGRTVLVADVVHHLLHLCLHFAWSHLMRFGSWRTFRDINTLVRRYDVNWDDVEREAKQARASTSCYWTFRLARNLVGVPIPPELLRSLRPPRSESMLNRLERHFAVELLPNDSVCPSVRFEYAMWTMAVMPRWSGHGAIRPWHGDDHTVARLDGVPARSRLVSQLRNVLRWRRYLRAVLSGAE